MNRKGFTLIELVIVIALIGILAVYAAPRMVAVTDTKGGAFADKLRADIRYAQNLAMTQNKRYRVYFNSNPPGAPVPAIPNPGYGVVYDTSVAQNWSSTAYAQDPAGGGNLRVTLGGSGQYAGITITSPANGYVEFNSLGTPAVGGALMFVVDVATVTITPGGQQVTIRDQTGAVN